MHDRYKDLAQVEWAFRDSKSVHLEMRPVYLRAENRTRGHAVVVMLAYLMAQELRRRWRDSDLTVQEALDRLAGLCVTEVRIGGRPSYNQVPTPRDDVRRLFEAANVAIPTALPLAPARVATKTKTPTTPKSEISFRPLSGARSPNRGNIRWKRKTARALSFNDLLMIAPNRGEPSAFVVSIRTRSPKRM